MPSVIGSTGKTVSVEMLGVNEVIRRLREAGKDIQNNVDLEVVKLGAFMEEEVKESIIGARDELKSVETGHFANDVKAEKIGDGEVLIAAKSTPYAIFLEEGTSKIGARHHFRNSLERNKEMIHNKIEQAVNKSLS